MARRNNCPGPRMCVWPANSGRLRGRIRAASGTCLTGDGSAASATAVSGADGAANKSSFDIALQISSLRALYQKQKNPAVMPCITGSFEHQGAGGTRSVGFDFQ